MPRDAVVIVNADDFGLTEGVNRGIVSCHRAGNVTSTTLMVNMPAVEHALCCADDNPQLAVGWHANLTQGLPVFISSRRSALLGDDGTFMQRGRLARRLLMRRVPKAVLEDELQAQYQRYLSFGRRPTHIDSHQHVHAFPQVFDVLAGIAEREGIPIRMPWRWPGNQRGGLSKWLKAGGMDWLVRSSESRWRDRLCWNSGLCSLFDLTYDPSDISLPLYERLLGAYDAGCIELMVMPPAPPPSAAAVAVMLPDAITVTSPVVTMLVRVSATAA